MTDYKPIYELGNDHTTISEAIRVFAATYWDKPRKAMNINPGPSPMTAIFDVCGGYKHYRIQPTDKGTCAFVVSVSIN